MTNDEYPEQTGSASSSVFVAFNEPFSVLESFSNRRLMVLENTDRLVTRNAEKGGGTN